LNKAREGLTMALVEFSITVQTGDHIDDPLSNEDKSNLHSIMKELNNVIDRSVYPLEISQWEELIDDK
jgi:hypothetical protein